MFRFFWVILLNVYSLNVYNFIKCLPLYNLYIYIYNFLIYIIFLNFIKCLQLYNILGNDWKSLRTFAPAGYRVFWNYSPRQIPRQIPVPICLE